MSPKKFPTDFRTLLDQPLPGRVESLFFQHLRALDDRPSQLAELSRSPELFSHRAYVKLFVKLATKNAGFNILRQNETIFDIGNG